VSSSENCKKKEGGVLCSPPSSAPESALFSASAAVNENPSQDVGLVYVEPTILILNITN